MCLDRPETFAPCKTGWKIFGTGPAGEITSWMKGTRAPMPTNEWLSAASYRTSSHSTLNYGHTDGAYPKSFHVCHSKKAALKWLQEYHWPYYSYHLVRPVILAKVEVRSVHCTGTQDNHRITVAEEIMITSAIFKVKITRRGKQTCLSQPEPL